MLRKNQALQVLNLGGNKLSSEAVGLLARALKENTSLETLGLANNALGALGLKPLAELSFGNVRRLDLRGNDITDVASEIVAEGLVKAGSLAFLDVRENRMTQRGINMLWSGWWRRQATLKEKEAKRQKKAKKVRILNN